MNHIFLCFNLKIYIGLNLIMDLKKFLGVILKMVIKIFLASNLITNKNVLLWFKPQLFA